MLILRTRLAIAVVARLLLVALMIGLVVPRLLTRAAVTQIGLRLRRNKARLLSEV
jgi:uncharacterized membrane-anchored protein YhcB (DUF1043 family)